MMQTTLACAMVTFTTVLDTGVNAVVQSCSALLGMCPPGVDDTVLVCAHLRS